MRKFVLALIFLVSFLLLVSFTKSSIDAVAPVGNDLVLNGGYVKAENNYLVPPTLVSFNAKINPNTISGKQIILSIGDKSTGKLNYEIGINGGTLSLEYNSTNGSHVTLTAGNLTPGTWQDIAVVISSVQTRLSIDGIDVFSPFINNNNLSALGPNIVVGDSFKESFFDSKPYKGLLDEVSISNSSNLLLWHLDEARGETIANDSTANNIDGTLVGGDSLIHFFGVLPSPTPTPTQAPFGLSPIRWTRPVLPTLSFPFPFPSDPSPTNFQPPPDNNPSPTTSSVRDIPRPTRFSIR